ncbi:KDO2-lipid IV(A) lauroyltransferase [Ulvibacter sp. MAR_2010_11]|uniref:lysophospholipid acyltransferase family protein n=1 Tax=Ulvibacter sp. MAR_2010_11 TaxID=1250229 RepID=UPI000C2CC837|nr:lysophospholipid acyltransferase family protein [Ulvibacter sp. MAR_2010_11]PKA84378.1 KDO2-lipid IV(A) lauroyltransferase [Ulvibacter sp. MAR_2010_11]
MQRLLYLLIFPVLWIISLFPMRMLYITSDLLFLLLYYIVGYRKKTVRENLNLVFPEKSKAEKKSIEKKFYHHLCDMIVEAIKSLSISESELSKRFVPTNIEEVHAVEAQNKSIILMLAHYGSWEWIFVLQKYVGYKTHAIYKRLRNKYFDALIKRSRAKYKSYLITTKEAIPTLMRSKAKGELTLNGFVSDQSPKVTNIYHWNEFMNIKVPVFTGAELMAKRLDMAVVFCAVSRVKRGYYAATFKTITLNPKEYENYEITDIFLKLVEAQIREAPEYYLWTHKRWKHRDKVPEDIK